MCPFACDAFQHGEDVEDHKFAIRVERLGTGDGLGDLFPYLDPTIKVSGTGEPRHGRRFAVDQLWLMAPTGLFSLADAMGDPANLSDETRAHSSFYAVDPGRHKDLKIFWRVICNAFHGKVD